MVTRVSSISSQITLDFEPTLLEQFRTLKQCLAAVVYGSKGGLGRVAIHCNLSPPALSRMLNENEDDPRHLPVDLLPLIIEATGDMRPILWLVAKFMPDDATRDRVRNARIEQLLSELPSLLADWKANGKRR